MEKCYGSVLAVREDHIECSMKVNDEHVECDFPLEELYFITPVENIQFGDYIVLKQDNRLDPCYTLTVVNHLGPKCKADTTLYNETMKFLDSLDE